MYKRRYEELIEKLIDMNREGLIPKALEATYERKLNAATEAYQDYKKSMDLLEYMTQVDTKHHAVFYRIAEMDSGAVYPDDKKGEEEEYDTDLQKDRRETQSSEFTNRNQNSTQYARKN